MVLIYELVQLYTISAIHPVHSLAHFNQEKSAVSKHFLQVNSLMKKTMPYYKPPI